MKQQKLTGYQPNYPKRILDGDVMIDESAYNSDSEF